jgi:hypothetical protein
MVVSAGRDARLLVNRRFAQYRPGDRFGIPLTAIIFGPQWQSQMRRIVVSAA